MIHRGGDGGEDEWETAYRVGKGPACIPHTCAPSPPSHCPAQQTCILLAELREADRWPLI